MAIRVRSDGTMLCAALSDPMPGDTYIDDSLHYEMSVIYRVIVSEPIGKHLLSGRWWWRGAVPEGVKIAEQYDHNSAR